LHHSRTANKGPHLLDLEKYFKQQAALTEQKKKLKQASKTPDKDSVSVKKAKLFVTDARTNKRSQKSKRENSKDDTLQSIDKTDSNVVNETADNSSESEYIPSDNEIDSGNILFIEINSKNIRIHGIEIFFRCRRQDII